ncbi:hypothetical protein [Alteribacillus sp. HJP-4]|uniref:hypothetical protein n=1 Tax=Alteribacillus sp. HJP-4 TaxID=2775394 RepID=UPI0035CD38F5
MSETFKEERAEMERLGTIYRAIHSKYGDEIIITYMDPRNSFSILSYFLRCWKSGSIRLSGVFRGMLFGIRRSSFFLQWTLAQP